ncbi:hypothetical protein LV78_003047 [Actinosynnema pretiosum]|nr:hypothetical protein [Actinosynnema pretiosum]
MVQISSLLLCNRKKFKAKIESARSFRVHTVYEGSAEPRSADPKKGAARFKEITPGQHRLRFVSSNTKAWGEFEPSGKSAGAARPHDRPAGVNRPAHRR